MQRRAQALVIPAGRVFTAARTKISTVSPLLVANTLSRSQDKTVAARTLEILGFFVWGIGVATDQRFAEDPRQREDRIAVDR
jgi:hypothetical protein